MNSSAPSPVSLPTLENARSVAIFSRGIERLPHLRSFLGVDHLVIRPPSPPPRASIDAVVGWGHKPSAATAIRFAEQNRLPYVALEDGFLRSVGLGSETPPLSLVLDDVGVYYDARGPSRLEQLIEGPRDGADEDPLDSPELLRRATTFRERIVATEVSKYNRSSTRLPHWFRDRNDWVLLVDQTFGDASIEQGLATPQSFQELLTTALEENPDAPIVVKVHPDTMAGVKRGYLAGVKLPDRVRIIATPLNPVALLKCVKHVYGCTSQLGFEALLLGKKVTCFGVPFYSGWGLTNDRLHCPRRTRKISIERLVAAAFLVYPRYVHPITGLPCPAEVVLEHLALQRKRFSENARTYVCVGFSLWKRPFVRHFLDGPDSQIHFVRNPRAATRLARGEDTTLLVWTTRRPAWLDGVAARTRTPIWNMEDGFLRSVQLGSDLTSPASLVIDPLGIYYDPRTPSRLEHILQTSSFNELELARARKLRDGIVRSRVSKYNVGQVSPDALSLAEGDAHVVFVPGQVASDRSILNGSPAVRDDAALLSAVRRLRPKAFILYKPHPDVVSGNRSGSVPGKSSGLWDHLVLDAPLHACLDRADEVHTMTSLVGFEALLRNIPVVVHGQPFYAGWGLTEDVHPPPRRGRALSLDELVAATLIVYPIYFSARAGAFCEAEDVVEELARARDANTSLSVQSTWIARRARSLAILISEWRRAR